MSLSRSAFTSKYRGLFACNQVGVLTTSYRKHDITKYFTRPQAQDRYRWWALVNAVGSVVYGEYPDQLRTG